MFSIKYFLAFVFQSAMVSLFVGGNASAQPRLPVVNPKEVHNLKATTADSWIIYAWTDATAYRPNEPIGLSLRFLTETSDEFELPVVTVIISDSKDEVVVKQELLVKPTPVSDGILSLHHWKTPNLVPDSADRKLSVLNVKGNYTIKIEFKYKDGKKASLDKMAVGIGGR